MSADVLLLWDASALAKRYVTETGTDIVNLLFERVSTDRMVVVISVYVETHAVLVRRANAGSITKRLHRIARSALEREVLDTEGLTVLPIDVGQYLEAVPLVQEHNLNSSDAVILATYSQYARAATAVGSTCILVASDRRLLRAASEVGLRTLNPEGTLPSAIDSLQLT